MIYAQASASHEHISRRRLAAAVVAAGLVAIASTGVVIARPDNVSGSQPFTSTPSWPGRPACLATYVRQVQLPNRLNLTDNHTACTAGSATPTGSMPARGALYPSRIANPLRDAHLLSGVVTPRAGRKCRSRKTLPPRGIGPGGQRAQGRV